METYSLIQPNSWVALRLPNGSTRLLQIIPNTYEPPYIITALPTLGPADTDDARQ